MGCARASGNRVASAQVLAIYRRSMDARCLRKEKRVLFRIRGRNTRSRARGQLEPPFSFCPFLPTRAGVESAHNKAEHGPSAGPTSQGEIMRRTVLVLGTILLACLGVRATVPQKRCDGIW